MLKRLRHLQFDFENNPSADENDQISKCRKLLRDGELTQADSLWTHLKQFARGLASSGGVLTRQQLADRLRPTFSLKEFPEYEADWQRIAHDFDMQAALVKDKLGAGLVLQREELDAIARDGSISALVGSSGSGKSALAKQHAIGFSDTRHKAWLTAQVLNAARPNTIFAELGLSHSFTELLSQSLVQKGIVVVDAIERLNQTGIPKRRPSV